MKTTGAAALGAGAVAMGGLSPMTKAEAADAAATEGETIVRTSCRGNCGSKCPTNVVVRDGKVVRVAAAELPGDDAPRRRFCVKGYTQPQRVYDPDRLKYPMKRTGERGEGQWERISWDEAIDTIVGKMGAAVQEAGGTSIAFWSSYGSYGVLNGQMAGYMSVGYGRMITALGATVLGAGADYAQIYEQSTLLGISGNDTADIANAKTIMAWGGNPAEAYIHDWHYVCDARENGAKLITIDPQFTASAAHSDIYVPIRPATDGALMLGMANYIIDNELMDTDFMKTKTVSPFLIKEDGTYFRMSDMGVEPTLKVNASDAAERGISQGDYVRVFNDRGYAVLKAVVTEGIKPGVVSIPHGFQADQFVEGHTQDLTNIVMNDFCSNSSFYDFLCEVEKYEGGER